MAKPVGVVLAEAVANATEQAVNARRNGTGGADTVAHAQANAVLNASAQLP